MFYFSRPFFPFTTYDAFRLPVYSSHHPIFSIITFVIPVPGSHSWANAAFGDLRYFLFLCWQSMDRSYCLFGLWEPCAKSERKAAEHYYCTVGRMGLVIHPFSMHIMFYYRVSLPTHIDSVVSNKHDT
jgi:hypothetical protein